MGERVTLEDDVSGAQVGTSSRPVYIKNAADGTATASVAPGAGASDVTTSAGFLASVTVTAAGTAATTITDHGGTTLGVIPANPTVGAVYAFRMPVASGIQVAGNANRSTVTIAYS